MKRGSLLAAISMMIFCVVARPVAAVGVDDQPQSNESDAVGNARSDRKIVHVLNRLTFGPRPHDIESVRAMGLESFIEQQLNPFSLAESPAVRQVDAMSETSHQSNEDLLRIYTAVQSERNKITAKRALQEAAEKPAEKPAEKLAEKPAEKTLEKPAGMEVSPDQQPAPQSMIDYFNRAQQQFILARLTRDIESPRQLDAVMTEFWFNHFNVFQGKEYDGLLLGSYENDAIRPRALGKFKDLVRATCYHPAMLYYLDNSQNKASVSVNENYARELMELHTLGVDGGYSQKDVIELARILTGLTIATHMRTGGLPQVKGLQRIGNQGAYFDKRQHDTGDKTLLGHHIQGSGGVEEIEQALDILAKHPSTAHHICYQLVQYFLCDEPPPGLVEKLQERFISTDGDVRAVLRALFSSNEFWDEKYDNIKFKTPLRYAISLVRAAGGHIQKSDRIAGFLNQQGQRLYGCLTPDGYKNTKLAWLDPDALLHRIEFALQVGSGKVPGIEMPPPDYRQLESTLGRETLSANTIEVVEKAPKNLKAAAVLGGPELMRY